MADGFDIHIEAKQASHLAAAAKAKGVDVQDYVRELLDAAVNADDPGAIFRARREAYERTGLAIPAEKALADFRTAVETRLVLRKA